MGTAFGIFLFLIVYGPVAYLVYRDVSRDRSLRASGATRVRWHRPELTHQSDPRRVPAA